MNNKTTAARVYNGTAREITVSTTSTMVTHPLSIHFTHINKAVYNSKLIGNFLPLVYCCVRLATSSETGDVD